MSDWSHICIGTILPVIKRCSDCQITTREKKRRPYASVLRWQDMKNPGSVHADPYDNNRKVGKCSQTVLPIK